MGLSRRVFMGASLSVATASVMAVTNVAEASANKPQKWDKTVNVVIIGSGGAVLQLQYLLQNAALRTFWFLRNLPS